MHMNSTQFSALFFACILAGCTATNIAYTPSAKMEDKQAAAMLVDLSLSQNASSKPLNIEIQETSILWEKDRMYFVTIKNVELLQKSEKYQVQINFNGNVFRKDDWFVAYQTGDIDEAKHYIDALTSLIASRNGSSRNVVVEAPGKTVAPQ